MFMLPSGSRMATQFYQIDLRVSANTVTVMSEIIRSNAAQARKTEYELKKEAFWNFAACIASFLSSADSL